MLQKWRQRYINWVGKYKISTSLSYEEIPNARHEFDSRNHSALNRRVIVLLRSSSEDLSELESENVLGGTIYCTVSISGTVKEH